MVPVPLAHRLDELAEGPIEIPGHFRVEDLELITLFGGERLELGAPIPASAQGFE